MCCIFSDVVVKPTHNKGTASAWMWLQNDLSWCNLCCREEYYHKSREKSEIVSIVWHCSNCHHHHHQHQQTFLHAICKWPPENQMPYANGHWEANLTILKKQKKSVSSWITRPKALRKVPSELGYHLKTKASSTLSKISTSPTPRAGKQTNHLTTRPWPGSTLR